MIKGREAGVCAIPGTPMGEGRVFPEKENTQGEKVHTTPAGGMIALLKMGAPTQQNGTDWWRSSRRLLRQAQRSRAWQCGRRSQRRSWTPCRVPKTRRLHLSFLRFVCTCLLRLGKVKSAEKDMRGNSVLR